MTNPNNPKLKIERPDWHNYRCEQGAEPDRRDWKEYKQFEKWFKEQVEPINKVLAEGIEVRMTSDQYWYDENIHGHGTVNDPRALLINIQPIKKWKCPCGSEGMFADTEDCTTPLCYDCAVQIANVLLEGE